MSASRTETDRRSADDPLSRRATGRRSRCSCGGTRRRSYNFALRQLRSAPAAEEVVQEAFVRVVQNARGVQARGALLDVALHDHAKPLHRSACESVRSASIRRSTNRSARGRRRADARRADGRRPGERRTRRASRSRSGSASLAAVDELPDEQREVFLMREVVESSLQGDRRDRRRAGEHREEPHALRARAPPGGAQRIRGVRARAALRRLASRAG